MFHIVRKFEDLRAAFAAEAGDGAAAPDSGGGAETDAHSYHRVFEVCAASTLCGSAAGGVAAFATAADHRWREEGGDADSGSSRRKGSRHGHREGEAWGERRAASRRHGACPSHPPAAARRGVAGSRRCRMQLLTVTPCVTATALWRCAVMTPGPGQLEIPAAPRGIRRDLSDDGGWHCCKRGDAHGKRVSAGERAAALRTLSPPALSRERRRPDRTTYILKDVGRAFEGVRIQHGD